MTWRNPDTRWHDDPTDYRHGTARGYVEGCGCFWCTDAARVAQQQARRRSGVGPRGFNDGDFDNEILRERRYTAAVIEVRRRISA